jgi:hypothetical protein
MPILASPGSYVVELVMGKADGNLEILSGHIV